MRFKRTTSTLKNLEQNQEISLVDILGIFQDVCNDLEEERGQTLDELQAGNEKALVGKLLWVGQELVSVFKANKDGVTNPAQAAKLAKQESKLDAEVKTLDMMKDDVRRLKEQEEKLLAVQNQKEELNKIKHNLIRSCNQLEEENEQCETVTLAELKQKKATLEKQNEELAKACLQLQTKENQLYLGHKSLTEDLKARQNQIRSLQDKIDAANGQVEKNQEKIEGLIEELQVLQTRAMDMETEKQALITKTNHMKSAIAKIDLNILADEYKQKVREYTELEQKSHAIMGEKNKVEVKKEMLEADLRKIKQSIASTTIEIENLEKEKKNKSDELDVMTLRITTLDSQKKEIIEKINNLDENMRTKNVEVLTKRYEEKAKEYAELEMEEAKVLSEEKTVEVNIVNLKNRIASIQKLIDENQVIIADLHLEKNTVLEVAEEAKLRKIKLEEWFQGMEYQAYNDETQRLNKRLDVLKRAKAALCNEMDKEFFMVEDESKEQMRVFREDLEMTLKNMQNEMDNLQRRYMIVSKVIYSEGESLL